MGICDGSSDGLFLTSVISGSLNMQQSCNGRRRLGASKEQELGMAFVTYRSDLGLDSPSEMQQIEFSINGKPLSVNNLQEPIAFSVQRRQTAIAQRLDPRQGLACVYLSQNSSWSSAGLVLVGIQEKSLRTLCQTTHLTILSAKISELPEPDKQLFNRVTLHTLERQRSKIVVGAVVSIFVLFAAAFVVNRCYQLKRSYKPSKAVNTNKVMNSNQHAAGVEIGSLDQRLYHFHGPLGV
jgi:hypothetical protein